MIIYWCYPYITLKLFKEIVVNDLQCYLIWSNSKYPSQCCYRRRKSFWIYLVLVYLFILVHSRMKDRYNIFWYCFFSNVDKSAIRFLGLQAFSHQLVYINIIDFTNNLMRFIVEISLYFAFDWARKWNKAFCVFKKRPSNILKRRFRLI